MKQFVCLVIIVCGALCAHAQKSVSILGDSYSTYQDYVQPDSNLVWYPTDPKGNDVQHVQQTWWQLFLRQTGLRLCQNNSYSGATICYTGYDGADYADRSFVTRAHNLGSPDIIIVFGGTNDSWANAPIGEYMYQDWQKADLYGFRPALACLLDYLANRYPNTPVYFVLNTELKPEINQSVADICTHYGVSLIVLRDIDKQWGHPSQLGMQQIARQVAEQIK